MSECLDAMQFVLLSFFTLIETIWLKIWAKPSSKNEKGPLPVEVRRSKTSLLKLTISDDMLLDRLDFGSSQNTKPFKHRKTFLTDIFIHQSNSGDRNVQHLY